jgi:hypothetical protein
MKLKLDDAGHVAVADGKPVYVADDGKEVAFDYASTLGTITRLNGEAKNHRERAEAAEAKVKLYDGIDDPAVARDALATVKGLGDKKLFDAGKIDEIKAEAKKAFDEQVRSLEAQYKPVVEERDGLKASLFKEIIGGSFSRSKFIADKLAIPSDLAEARFGNAFGIEEGKVVAKDSTGNRIFSRARPGELATFDEALETLVDGYAHRDSILKGSGASGGGAASGGTGAGGKRTMTRAAFDALAPGDRMAAIKSAEIVD